MMLGLAIGDSLGRPTEGMFPENRRARLGEIKDYLPSSYGDGPIGVPTDDTQLAFWPLEQMINDTRDNVTIGAIVGAAVGALYGKDAIPERWIINHSGRTSFSDDGRIFDLLVEAKNLWG